MKFISNFFSRLFGSNPRKRGRRVALTALLAFNAPQDAVKFHRIKGELKTFLDSGRAIDKYMVIRFSNAAAERLEVNPLAFRVLVASLVEEIQSEPSDHNARLFIEGIVEALDLMGG